MLHQARALCPEHEVSRSPNRDWRSNRNDDLLADNQALHDRLSKRSEASLRINESLDFKTMLQGVPKSTSAPVQASCGVVTFRDA